MKDNSRKIRRRLYWMSILLILMALVWYGYSYYIENIKINSDKIWQNTITKTLASKSYSFHVKLDLNVGDHKVQLSDIVGQKNQKNFHITGIIQNQKIEAFQIGNMTYLKDSINKKWLRIPDNAVFIEDYFLAEINPLSLFAFTNIEDFRYLGLAKANNAQYYIFTCKGSLNNPFFNKFFEDFKYKIWVEKTSKRITKATIIAQNKQNLNNTLNVQVKISEFDHNFKFIAPNNDK
jgi:hypothetical protein